MRTRLAGRAFPRHSLVVVAFLALLGARCAPFYGAPSFIVILVDTLRVDYLGCYGFKGPVSPSIDAIARESYIFRNCYSSAPWTKPSVASLFTSLSPMEHGV